MSSREPEKSPKIIISRIGAIIVDLFIGWLFLQSVLEQMSGIVDDWDNAFIGLIEFLCEAVVLAYLFALLEMLVMFISCLLHEFQDYESGKELIIGILIAPVRYVINVKKHFQQTIEYVKYGEVTELDRRRRGELAQNSNPGGREPRRHMGPDLLEKELVKNLKNKKFNESCATFVVADVRLADAEVFVELEIEPQGLAAQGLMTRDPEDKRNAIENIEGYELPRVQERINAVVTTIIARARTQIFGLMVTHSVRFHHRYQEKWQRYFH